jgi:TolB-like protein/Flp pilus assembly protein TadD
MSEKHDQEYFSDGLSEELIDRLAQSQDLRVISRTSSFYFKGKPATIGEIGKTLNVGHVLEGSVRKSGKVLRITAQLIRVSDGSHLWSDSYDRDLADIFKLQGDIATTVATALKVAIARNEGSSENSEVDAEAYSLLLQGNYFVNRNTEPDVKKAIAFYEGAIKLDPGYALPWAKLATAYLSQANNGWAPTIEANAKGRDAAKRAISIDANLAEAHRVLADLLYYDFSWSGARSEYERAIELNPNDARIRASLAELAGALSGHLDDAIAHWRRHLARDPLDTEAFDRLAWVLINAGRFDESIATGLELQQLHPAYASNRARVALGFLLLGRYSEALNAAEKERDESWRLTVLPAVYWALGRRKESGGALSRLKERQASVGAVQIAQMHAYRGEFDAAFAWLDRAYRQRDGGLTVLKIDPLLRPLHADPRFQTLLVKMKLDRDPPAFFQ